MASNTSGATYAKAPTDAVEENAGNTPSTKISNEKSLEESAGILSYIFLTYLDPIFAKGNLRPLELSDLGSISTQDRSDHLYTRFVAEYEKERVKPLEKRSLWYALWRTVGYSKLVFALLLFCVSAAFQFGPVLILTRLVRHFAGMEEMDDVGVWLCVAFLFLFPMITSITLAHSNQIMAHLGKSLLYISGYHKSQSVTGWEIQELKSGIL